MDSTAAITSSYLDTPLWDSTLLSPVTPSLAVASSSSTDNIQSMLVSVSHASSLPHHSTATYSTQSTISPTLVQRDTTASSSITEARNASVLFDVVSDSTRSSTSEGSILDGSSASLVPSSTVFDRTLTPFTASLETNGTSHSQVLPENSLDTFSQSESVSSTMFVDNTQRTSISPTPSSTSGWWGESTSSTVGGGDVVVPNDVGNGDSLTDALIVFIPVGVTVVIVVVIIIVLCVTCSRRKRKKEELKAGQEMRDLWVDPDSQQVPATPLGVIYVAESTSAAADGGGPLYKALYKFPGQLESQLTLTPGDVIHVLEEADNGWLRGAIKGDNLRSGWFPSGFVAPVKGTEESQTTTFATASSPDVMEPGEEPQGGRPRISSFLIRKKPSKRPPQLDTVPRDLVTLHAQNSLNKQSRSAATVTPVSPVKIVDSNPLSMTKEDFSTSVKGKHYKALFPYKAAYRGELTLREGEIVLGLERDRNGWMLGRKVHGTTAPQEEGWFPAVYVDQVTGDVSNTSQTTQEEDCVTSSQLKRDVYTLLEVNRNKSPDQAWVAIEHRVIADFAAEGGSQLSLRVGDVVDVVQALQCGWCLGCHGEQLGWFPAAHVQLLEERSKGKEDSFSLLPLCRDPQRAPQRHDTTPYPTLDSADHHHRPSPALDISQDSVLSEGASDRPRPARRAPMAPLLASQGLHGSLGNISTASGQSLNPRPARPAPAPPTSTTSRKPRSDSVDSMDRLEPQPGRPLVAAQQQQQQRKQRKPRVVRIPKERLGLDKLSSFPAPFPRSPSVGSCASPPVFQPSGAASNAFFGNIESQGSDRHVPTTAERFGEGRNVEGVKEAFVLPTDQDSFPTKSCDPETFNPEDNSGKDMGKQCREHVQEDVSDAEKRTEINEQDVKQKAFDQCQNGREDVAHAVLQTFQNDSSTNCHGKDDKDHSPSSPTATSIAVQTDAGMNEDFKSQLSANKISEMMPATPALTSALSSATGVTADEQFGSDRINELVKSSLKDGDSLTKSAKNTDGEEPCLESQDVELDSENNQEARSLHSDPSPKSETAGEIQNRSSDDTDLSRSILKPTHPLPDLLEGAQISLEPKAASPETRAKLRSGSQQPRPKEPENEQQPGVKLAPVVRPLSQKDVANEEQEGPVIPPEGLAGRVFMIVHHINRMASVEECPNPPRKTSLGTPQVNVNEAAGKRLEDVSSAQSSNPAAGPASAYHSSGHGLEAPNDDAGRSAVEGVNQFNTDHNPSSPASTTMDPGRSTEDGSSPLPDALQHTPDTRSSPIRRSRGDSPTRRQSANKGDRVAPPPPTSPPPPITRKSQKARKSRETSCE